MKKLNTILAASLLLAPATLALGQDERETVDLLRVYDTRDISGHGLQGGVLTLVPRLTEGEDGGTIELLTTVDRLDATDVVLEIAGISGLSATRLQNGVYVVTGSEPGHEQLVYALDAYRAINGERYIVQLEAHSVVMEVAPSPGDPAPATSGTPIFRSNQTVNARADSIVQATTVEQYVSGWVPVVGTQAVGYQVQFAKAENGFSGEITVGAGEAADGRVNVRLAGVALKSDISTSMVKLSGDELPLSTVRRQERGIESSVAAPIGQRIVLASVTGFEANTVIIVTASVRAVPNG